METNNTSTPSITNKLNEIPRKFVYAGIALILVLVLVIGYFIFKPKEDEYVRPNPVAAPTATATTEAKSWSTSTTTTTTKSTPTPEPTRAAGGGQGYVNSRLPDRPAFLSENEPANKYAPDKSAPPNDELDNKATNFIPVLDRIVHNTKLNEKTIASIKQDLENRGAKAGPNLNQAFESLGYIGQSDDIIYVTRSMQPFVYAAETPGVYEVTYEVAAGMVPTVGQNKQDAGFRERAARELDASLHANVNVPVKFIINLNTGTIDTDLSQWWG